MAAERVPPGQYATDDFPVLHFGDVPRELGPDNWTLDLYGPGVDRPLRLTYTELLALPQTDLICDIHCVTGWTKFDAKWRGVRLLGLFQKAGINGKGKFAVFECHRGFTTSLPVAQLDQAILAHTYDSKPLPKEHGGPVRVVVGTSRQYFYKSAKWVLKIRVQPQDEPGFWEVRGYSNTADPWTEDRYAV